MTYLTLIINRKYAYQFSTKNKMSITLYQVKNSFRSLFFFSLFIQNVHHLKSITYFELHLAFKVKISQDSNEIKLYR